MAFKNYIFILIYILFTAYSTVFINVDLADISVNLITFSIFFTCWVFFMLLNRKRVAAIFQIAKQEPKAFLIINMTTLLCWLGMFWCLKMISASVQTLLSMSIIPFASVLMSEKWKSINFTTIFSVVAVTILAFGIVYLNPTMEPFDFNHQLFGVVLALLCGVSSAVYITSSSDLQKRCNLTASDIVCLRLPVMLVATFLMSLSSFDNLYILVSTQQLFNMLFLSFMGVIIPIFMIQASITKIGGVRTSVLIPLVPITAMLLEWWKGFSMVPLAIIMTGLQCLAIMYASHAISKDKARNSRAVS